MTLSTFRTFLFLIATWLLASCSTLGVSSHTEQNSDQATTLNESPATLLSDSTPIAGNLETTMDAQDKIKLSRALDAALGKSTTWKNDMSHIAYTVTPLRKAHFSNYQFCRTYHVKADKGGQVNEVQGTACIGENGSWQVVS
ncbi:MAG: hypothetical protein A3E85_01005 [Gammaproteobacteria bacterium RIFCSPHIGHO2_12_FULL_45_12]|nr:MAG: hypothetical protein A3E85_01005 [Gammaproteobacteria bacterium RIFCSPHIGHO2_12_FULL_45_12]